MIEFFRKNRGVSGSISILLSLLLLPIYSLAALLIESARYQSAKEQLNELTYLGELAILADYVDFLAENYDIYAFNGKNMNETFEEYVQNAYAKGTISTTKLADFLGLDEASCDVKFMYSAADPDVLEYQITQIGRFAMPADILSKNITLFSLVKSLEDKLKAVTKKLKLINAAADAYEDGTKIVETSVKMTNDTVKLKSAIGAYDTAYQDYINAAEKADWDSVKSDDFKLVYDKSSTDRDKAEKQAKELKKYNDLMSAIDANVKSYFDISNSDDRKKVEISLTDDEKDLFGIKDDGNIKLETVLDKLADQLSDYSGISVTSIGNYSQYNKIMKEALSSQSSDEKLVKAYDSFKNTKEALEKYNIFKAAADALYSSYGTYVTDMKAFTKSIKETIDSIDTINATNTEIYIDELNNDTVDASRAKYNYDQIKNSSEVGEEEKKVNEEAKKEAVKKRKESYDEAKKNKDYAMIGSNVMEQFAKNVSDTQLDEWKENLEKKIPGNSFVDGLPNLDSLDSTDSYIKAVEKIQNIDIKNKYKTVIKEYDFSTAMGLGGPAVSDPDGSAEKSLEQMMVDVISWQIGNKKELEINISQDTIDKYYNSFCESSLNPDESWFVTNDNDMSYYYSTGTLAFLTMYLGASSAAKNSVIETLMKLVKAFTHLFPENALLNNHIGNNRESVSGTNGVTFPSGMTFSDGSDRRTGAFNYAKSVLGEGSGGKLDISDNNSYYVYGSSNNSLYNSIFGGRQPGQSVQTLVEASGGFLESIDSIIKSVQGLRLIKLLFAIRDFFKSVGGFIKALIEFAIDVVQIIGAVINDIANGTTNVLSYIFDQLYIGYYINEHFKSRQTANITDFSTGKNATNEGCALKGGGQCCTNNRSFDGAQMEYILIGSPCEITNQRYAYFAILAFRLLVNLPVAAADKHVQKAMSNPLIGVIVLVGVDVIESKLDMMFMLCGQKVPIIKDKLNFYELDKFIDSIDTILSEEIKMQENKQMSWTMEKDKQTGRSYRKYKNNDVNKKITEQSQKSFGVGTNKNKMTSEGGILQLDYSWYINLLLLLYPADTKLLRAADLMQMEGMQKDPSFRLGDCYTYVAADVKAKFNPTLPLLTDGNDLTKLKPVESYQYNGY